MSRLSDTFEYLKFQFGSAMIPGILIGTGLALIVYGVKLASGKGG